MNGKEKDLKASNPPLLGSNAETKKMILKYYQNRGLFQYEHADDQHEKKSRTISSKVSCNE